MVLGAIPPSYSDATDNRTKEAIEKELALKKSGQYLKEQLINPPPTSGGDQGDFFKKYGPYIIGAIVLLIILNKK
jgi:hypothetical protein